MAHPSREALPQTQPRSPLGYSTQSARSISKACAVFTCLCPSANLTFMLGHTRAEFLPYRWQCRFHSYICLLLDTGLVFPLRVEQNLASVSLRLQWSSGFQVLDMMITFRQSLLSFELSPWVKVLQMTSQKQNLNPRCSSRPLLDASRCLVKPALAVSAVRAQALDQDQRERLEGRRSPLNPPQALNHNLFFPAHTHTHTHTHTTHSHTHTHTHIYTTCIHTHTHIYNTHTHAHIYTTHTYIHILTHTHTPQTHTIHTHTHTQATHTLTHHTHTHIHYIHTQTYIYTTHIPFFFFFFFGSFFRSWGPNPGPCAS
ncbi:uncharacterized protein LOC108348619 [Rattus norvegicus]|uniref:uncharacterized protein LOC108348619 n=1 Tax=Rattus norvegicus TaxID=10116 RepID=UPI002FD7B7CF